jgi:hypothetical protein
MDESSSTVMPYRTASRRVGLELKRRGLAVALALALVAPAALASEQQRFASPEEATEAFGTAVVTSDEDAMKAMLGADLRRYIPLVDQDITLRFIQAWAKSHRVVPAGQDKALIEVGTDGWTMPIPIVKAGASWRFDVEAGAEEMRVRHWPQRACGQAGGARHSRCAARVCIPGRMGTVCWSTRPSLPARRASRMVSNGQPAPERS